MEVHEHYMRRCIALSKAGLLAAMPNPCVGAVLVYNNTIIGEGHTSAYGGPHAEVNCINSVSEENKHLIKKATLYVSLEPCSHFGKTPPCSDLIIENSIPKVIIGTIDTFSKVSGNGVKRLRESNVQVITGILEEECREVNKRFFTYHEKKRPYIILKWAETANGFISPGKKSSNKENFIENKAPVWITNSYSRQLVHKWRSEEQAILVGTNTVLEDNPKLDVRDWTGSNPVRIVLDKSEKINDGYFVKNRKNKTIFLSEKMNFSNLDTILYEKIDFNEDLPFTIMKILYKHSIQSVIIEGGSKTLKTFIDAGLWDEARVFKGETVFENGVKAPQITGILTKRQLILNDELLIFRNYD